MIDNKYESFLKKHVNSNPDDAKRALAAAFNLKKPEVIDAIYDDWRSNLLKTSGSIQRQRRSSKEVKAADPAPEEVKEIKAADPAPAAKIDGSIEDEKMFNMMVNMQLEMIKNKSCTDYIIKMLDVEIDYLIKTNKLKAADAIKINCLIKNLKG